MPKLVDRIPAFESLEENMNFVEQASTNKPVSSPDSNKLRPATAPSGKVDFKVDSSKYVYTLISENMITMGDLAEIRQLIREYVDVTDAKSTQHGRGQAILLFMQAWSRRWR